MQQKSPVYFLLTMSTIALVAVAYVVYDIFSITSTISNNQDPIAYDSGTYYLLLLSIFWLLSYIEYSGRKNGIKEIKSFASKSITLWFLVSLLLANLIPWYLQKKFDENGYVACDDPAEINRVARGASYIFKKNTCD